LYSETLKLLTGKEAAKSLCISERTLYTLVKENRINAVRIGSKCVRFDTRDLEQFILECKGGVRPRTYQSSN